ncbi:MAG: diguanylate cyclase [Janthinobacterium lividum]
MIRSASSPRRQRSLTAAVIGAMVLVWAMLVGIAAWRSWQDRAAWIERDTAETANLARSLAQHAHDAIRTADTAVLDLRALIEIEGMTPRTLGQLRTLMAAQLAGSPVIGALAAFDADGNWTANSMAQARPYSIADRPYFEFHRMHADRGVHVGEPVRSRMTGEWILPVSRRIDAPGGAFAGIMLAMLPAALFQDLYASFDVGAQGTIALLSTEGTVVAHTRLASQAPGRDAAGGPLFHGALARPSLPGVDYVSGIDGVRRLGSTRRVEDFPFLVVVSHGYDEALSRWRTDARASVVVCLAASLVVLLLGVRLARQARRGERVEAALARSESHYRLIAENGTDLVTRLDAAGRLTYVSPSSEALTGHAPHALLGGHVGDLVHPRDWPALSESLAPGDVRADAFPVSFRLARGEGAEVWLEATGRRMEDGGHVLALRDVTRRKQSETDLHTANNRLQRLVMQDGLTCIANRRCFDLTLQKELRRQARADLPLALLMVDVDHFKLFNDAYGHAAGDGCLRAIAGTMAGQMQRPADLVARFGGEEFGVILPDTDKAGALVMAERVRCAVRSLAIAHSGNAGGIATISIGVAVVWPKRGDVSPEDLVALADGALYEAKHGGRNRAVLAPDPAAPALARALP